MFQDTKQELERLQEALLDEPEDRDLPGIDELLEDRELQELLDGQEDTAVPVQEPVEEEKRPPVRGIRGLLITAGLLTLAIVAVVLWWVWRIL